MNIFFIFIFISNYLIKERKKRVEAEEKIKNLQMNEKSCNEVNYSF